MVQNVIRSIREREGKEESRNVRRREQEREEEKKKEERALSASKKEKRTRNTIVASVGRHLATNNKQKKNLVGWMKIDRYQHILALVQIDDHEGREKE